MTRIKYAVFVFIEKLLHWCIIPQLRAKILRALGAKIGKNVRVYEVKFINLEKGFSNLHVEDDVHIGTDCLLDLAGELKIGKGSTLSPRVLVLTHQDPGRSHDSPLIEKFPSKISRTQIGANCWIGANVSIIAGCVLQDFVVVAAGSVVTKEVSEKTLVAGVPARHKKNIVLSCFNDANE